MEIQYDKIKSDCTVSLGSAQSVVESVLSEVTAESIGQVLSLSADVRALSAEALNGEAVLSGRVNFKLLYLAENEPKSLDIFADFNERIVDENITPAQKLIPTMQVLDAEAVRSGAFKLRAVVESSVGALVKQEKQMLAAVEESVHVDYSQARLTEHVGTANLEINLSGEEETGGNVEKVLLLDTSVLVTGAKTGENVVLVTGEAEFKVLYTQDEKLHSEVFSLPFDEEVTIEGVSLTDLATAHATVTSARVVLAGEENANILRVEVAVALRVDAFIVCAKELPSDAFSLKNELELVTETATVESLVGCCSFGDRVSGIAALADGKPSVRDIVGSYSARNQMASVVAGDGVVTLEGLVTATVVYMDENGLASVQVELPYSFTSECPYSTEGARLTVQAAATDVTAKAKRDHEIEVTAKLTFNVDIFAEQTLDFVSDIVFGEEKPQNTSTVSVFIASEGESIWAAVKALTATPEEILAQNPGLTLPFAEGDRVVFFRFVG